jgi:hypothetical protein
MVFLWWTTRRFVSHLSLIAYSAKFAIERKENRKIMINVYGSVRSIFHKITTYLKG